jgi:micrococcal nuclease
MKLPLWHYRAVILSAYDADTCAASVDLGFDIRINLTLRLLNVWAPEVTLRGTTTEADKRKGLYARDALRERVVNEHVIIQTEKDRKEKYGRYLATIWHQEQNVNEWITQLLERYKP